MRHYIHTFKPIPDSKNVTVEVLKQTPDSLKRAKNILHSSGREGYITVYPSTKPVYAFIK